MEAIKKTSNFSHYVQSANEQCVSNGTWKPCDQIVRRCPRFMMKLETEIRLDVGKEVDDDAIKLPNLLAMI